MVAVHAAAGTAEADLLRMAGAAESGSEHPIGRAITDHARTSGPLPALDSLQNRSGLGVVAVLSDGPSARGQGDPWWWAGPGLLNEEALIIDDAVRAAVRRRAEPGAYASARRLGRSGPRRGRGVRHRQAELGRRRPGAPRPGAAARAADRRPSGSRRRPSPRRSGSTTVVAGVLPAREGGGDRPAAGVGSPGGDGRRRGQRRRRARPGRPGHRDGHRHRRGHRGRRPDPAPR